MVELSQSNTMDLIQSMIAPLPGPLGTSALVLLVILMLLQREDLRNRLIRPARKRGELVFRVLDCVSVRFTVVRPYFVRKRSLCTMASMSERTP